MSAESDARMLANLRQWRGVLLSIVELSPEEFDLLLRIADERDQLRRDLCEEQQGRGRRPLDRVTEPVRLEYTIAAQNENGSITQLGADTTVVRADLESELARVQRDEEALGGRPDLIFIAQRPIPKWVRS